MASRIQGITVEIGGDTTKLSKALEGVNKSIKGTQSGLKDILKRNDIKKSDAYQSGFLEGTTPAYEAYMRLKKNLAASIH